jgi:sugar phosphate isomerase/epimerase
MQYSVCSYSFHRTFDDGEMDIFDYITWCKEHGFTQLDPWMKHVEAGFADDAYLDRVKEAANDAGLPFGCLAVDGAHIYEPAAAARAENRQKAYRWIDVAERLGAAQIRIDAGGRDVPLSDILDIVIEGYNDLVPRAKAKGVEVIIENHWGPTRDPDAMHLVLDGVQGLGLLLDSANWPEGTHERAWRMFASSARLTHMKTFSFDDDGNEANYDLALFISLLRHAVYQGSWGIEYEGKDGGDERAMVLKSLALLKRVLGDE